MNYKTIRRWVKDFNLPIAAPDEEHINYFVNLYDKVLQTKEKYQLFNNAIEKYGSEENFFVESNRIQNEIIDSIKGLPNYELFLSNTKDNYNSTLHLNVTKDQVYKTHSDGYIFLSIDLVKANYNALKYFSSDLVLNSQNYIEFMKNFTKEEYFLTSKKFRQVVFGNINPKRQQKIQRYLIDLLFKIIDQYVSEDCIKDITSDEVVLLVQLDKMDTYSSMINEVTIVAEQLGIEIRCDLFELQQMKPYNYYVRKYYDGRLDFRCIPLHHYAQVYKHYFNLPINDFDLTFYTSEQELVKSLKPLIFDK